MLEISAFVFELVESEGSLPVKPSDAFTSSRFTLSNLSTISLPNKV